MTLLRCAHSPLLLLHSHSPTAPTANRHFPPPRSTTARPSIPSPQRRRFFTPKPNPSPLPPFPAQPLRRFSASASSSSPPVSPVFSETLPISFPSFDFCIGFGEMSLNCRTVCCARERFGSANRSSRGMWMSEMVVPRTFSPAKPLICRLPRTSASKVSFFFLIVNYVCLLEI